MAIQGVLTGDLIDYRKASLRRTYTDMLRLVLDQLAEIVEVRSETFRGDGFQLVTSDPADVVLCGVLVRAALIGASPKEQRWDARVSIGIGVEETAEGDDGEAFILSGLGLDRMKGSTMSFHAKNKYIYESMRLATKLATVVINDWTPTVARTYFTYRSLDRDREATAMELKKGLSTVTKALLRGHAREIDSYVLQAKKWIREMDDD